MKSKERKVNFFEAVILFLTIVGVMLWGAIIGKTPTAINLAICTAILGSYGSFVCNIKWNDLMDSAVENVKRAMPTIYFIMVVGAVAGTWIACGTVPFLMYWGLKLIHPSFLLFLTYFILAIITITTGQSWAMVTSIGLGMAGVGAALGIPLPLIAGAAVSGAFLGDKWSPISDVTSLNASISGETTYRIFSHMMPTTGLGAMIAGIMYLIVGFRYTADTVDAALVNEMCTAISGSFNLNIMVLLPLVAMLGVAIFIKLPITPVVFGSVVLAVFTGMIFQGKSLAQMLLVCWNGAVVSSSESGSKIVGETLSKGGLTSFSTLIIMLLIALVMSGFISRVGVLDAIMGKIEKNIKSRGMLILVSSFTSILLVWCTSSVNVSNILSYNLYEKIYNEKFNLHRINLCRTIGDCAAMFGAIVPWSGGALLASSAFGISSLSYAPYVWACYIPIILGIIFGFVGSQKMYPTYEQQKQEMAEAYYDVEAIIS